MEDLPREGDNAGAEGLSDGNAPSGGEDPREEGGQYEADPFEEEQYEVESLYAEGSTIYDISEEADGLTGEEDEEIPEEEDEEALEEEGAEKEEADLFICPVCGEQIALDLDEEGAANGEEEIAGGEEETAGSGEEMAGGEEGMAASGEETAGGEEEMAHREVVCPNCGEIVILGLEYISFDEENAEQLRGEYILDEIIIKFKDPSQVPGKERRLRREIDKVQKIGFVEDLGLYVVKADDLMRDANAVLNRYKNNRYVEYVEPNYIFELGIIPNDANYKSQSLVLSLLNMQSGWDILMGSSYTVIAVIDSGVASHPDLPPLLPGYSAVAGLSPNNDKLGHGTGVAGTIGCVGNNTIGNAGVNWCASILPVKVDDANGTISVANLAKGIIWAADNGAHILNISLGTASDSTTLRNAIDYAYNKGCAIFSATGNDGKNAISYPARYANVMAVGSTTNGTTRVASSTYGPEIGVVAYDSFYTVTPTGGYGAKAGTSFASPQVAGLASLIWALNPGLTNEQIYRVIEEGVKTLGNGFNEQTGYGLINYGKTLQLAQTMAGGSSAAQAEAEAKAKAEAEAAAKAAAEAAAKAAAEAAAKAAAEAEAKAKAEAEAAAKAAAEAAAKAAAEAEAKAKAEAEAAAKAAAEAAAKAAAEAEAKAKAEAEAAAKAAAEAAAKAAAEAEAKAKAAAEAAAKAEAEAEAKAKAEAEAAAKAAAEAAAKAAAEAEAKAKAEAEAAAKAAAEAEAKAKAEAEAALRPPETPQAIKSAPRIVLAGFTEMTLEFGQPYKESGYLAVDSKNKNITTSVVVTSDVNVQAAGLYTVNYDVTDSEGLSARATRIVNVNPEPKAVTPASAPKITVNGSNPIILHQTSGTPYKEQSARAMDFDGNDISGLVQITGAVVRDTPGTYTLTYTVTSPVSGLSASTTRDVRIVAPKELKDPRTKYGLEGQGKLGTKITHTGVVASKMGFMDLQVASIDSKMKIEVQLIDTETKKTVLTDTFSAAGVKQYKIDASKYDLLVTVKEGYTLISSKYSIQLLMPENEVIYFFEEDEVPLYAFPRIAPIGSNPIILHLDSGTPYTEQGARAMDFLGNDISDRVATFGEPDRNKAGTYVITYSVTTEQGLTSQTTREVRILAPGEYSIGDAEIPLPNFWAAMGIDKPDSAVVANCAAVNVRASHGAQYPAVGVLHSGDTVIILDTKYNWVQISNGTVEGWVYGEYLK